VNNVGLLIPQPWEDAGTNLATQRKGGTLNKKQLNKRQTKRTSESPGDKLQQLLPQVGERISPGQRFDEPQRQERSLDASGSACLKGICHLPFRELPPRIPPFSSRRSLGSWRSRSLLGARLSNLRSGLFSQAMGEDID